MGTTRRHAAHRTAGQPFELETVRRHDDDVPLHGGTSGLNPLPSSAESVFDPSRSTRAGGSADILTTATEHFPQGRPLAASAVPVGYKADPFARGQKAVGALTETRRRSQSDSHRTPRWREMDSNHRFRGEGLIEAFNGHRWDDGIPP